MNTNLNLSLQDWDVGLHDWEIESLKNKITNLDFEPIAKKLLDPNRGQGWSLEQVEDGITRYQQFLLLHSLYPHIRLVPDTVVDMVWHHHILHTRKYDTDCQVLFGAKLNHDPLFGETENQSLVNQAKETTRSLFKKHFGVDVTLSECSNCSGCSGW